LKELADEVVVTGTKLMDFYTGELSPWAVAGRVLDQLQAAGLSDFAPFEGWVNDAGGYRMLTLPDDSSLWVLRLGYGERYVHLHTARYSPHSLRVPGVSLKTAIVANALARTRGQRIADLTTVNDARRTFLGLPPVAKLTTNGGLGEVLNLLAAND
jgi:hypothetical protein